MFSLAFRASSMQTYHEKTCDDGREVIGRSTAATFPLLLSFLQQLYLSSTNP